MFATTPLQRFSPHRTSPGQSAAPGTRAAGKQRLFPCVVPVLILVCYQVNEAVIAESLVDGYDLACIVGPQPVVTGQNTPPVVGVTHTNGDSSSPCR